MDTLKSGQLVAQTYRSLWKNFPIYLLVVLPLVILADLYEYISHYWGYGYNSEIIYLSIWSIMRIPAAVFVHRRVMGAEAVSSRDYLKIFFFFFLFLIPFDIFFSGISFLTAMYVSEASVSYSVDLTTNVITQSSDWLSALQPYLFFGLVVALILCVSLFAFALIPIYPTIASNRTQDIFQSFQWGRRYYYKLLLGTVRVFIYLAAMSIIATWFVLMPVWKSVLNNLPQDYLGIAYDIDAVWEYLGAGFFSFLVIVVAATFASISYMNIVKLEGGKQARDGD